jgi:hypothetical protein
MALQVGAESFFIVVVHGKKPYLKTGEEPILK